jgi:hypothetical protein
MYISPAGANCKFYPGKNQQVCFYGFDQLTISWFKKVVMIRNGNEVKTQAGISVSSFLGCQSPIRCCGMNMKLAFQINTSLNYSASLYQTKFTCFEAQLITEIGMGDLYQVQCSLTGAQSSDQSNAILSHNVVSLRSGAGYM